MRRKFPGSWRSIRCQGDATSLVPQEAAVVGISYEELCETIVTTSLEERKKG